MQRREFLKLAGASGVAIAAARMHEPTISKALHDQGAPVEVIKVEADEFDELVIDLEKAYSFELENEFQDPLFIHPLEPAPKRRILRQNVRIGLYCDDELRDWMLEGLHNSDTIRVIDRRIELNSLMRVAEASISVAGMDSDIMIDIAGMMLS